MKKISAFLLILVFLFLFLFLFLLACAKSQESMNVENLKRAQITMHEREVIDIMGKPHERINSEIDSSEYFLIYKTPVGFSDNIYIFMDMKTKKIRSINDGL